jgi:hypothetical protein
MPYDSYAKRLPNAPLCVSLGKPPGKKADGPGAFSGCEWTSQRCKDPQGPTFRTGTCPLLYVAAEAGGVEQLQRVVAMQGRRR